MKKSRLISLLFVVALVLISRTELGQEIIQSLGIATSSDSANDSDFSESSPSANNPSEGTEEANDRSDNKRGVDDGAVRILAAFNKGESDLSVESSGKVIRILPDDEEGSRHQKFVVELANGHTVMFAHNIDLAERVPCKKGDTIRFYGEYEWNDRGGVVHWTHHDPRGRRKDGWIEFDGETYK